MGRGGPPIGHFVPKPIYNEKLDCFNLNYNIVQVVITTRKSEGPYINNQKYKISA